MSSVAVLLLLVPAFSAQAFHCPPPGAGNTYRSMNVDESDKKRSRSVPVLNHKQRRSMIKKRKRKEKRQVAAKRREEETAVYEQSEEFRDRQIEQIRHETMLADLDKRKRRVEHKLWLKRELAIRLKKERKELEKTRQNGIVKNSAEDQVLDTMAWNAVAGSSLAGSRKDNEPFWQKRFITRSASEDSDDEELASERLTHCQLYAKTGACRFGRKCNLLHLPVRRSRILLLANMYRHPALDEPSISTNKDNQSDVDVWLEHEESDLLDDYLAFKEDVQTEMESRYGAIRRFLVCRNTRAYLRGNVYVEFERENDAYDAYVALSGRYFDGRQLSPQFRRIPSWRAAICDRHHCSLGDHKCTFLHIFDDP